MSAFVVNRYDVDILVTAYANLNPVGAKLLNLTRVGRELLRENIESVAFCYRVRAGRAKRSEMRDWIARELCAMRHYVFKRRRALPAAVAKIARCYDYQACEHPAYATSTAKQMVDALMAAYPESLPGCDSMPWGISGAADLMACGCSAHVDKVGKLW